MFLPTTLLALATLSLAEPAILVGHNAQNISNTVWSSIASDSNATSSAQFIGYDITRPFPSSQQDGWTLSIATKNNISDPSSPKNSSLTLTTMSLVAPDNGSAADESWHMCVYAFNVKPTRARSDGWGSGENPSCKHLVQPECLDDLQKKGISKFRGDLCSYFDFATSCLGDLERSFDMAVSISDKDAATMFSNNTPFFKRIDGSYRSNETDEETVTAAAVNRPMAVLTVWGPSDDPQQKPFADVTCVMPAAKRAKPFKSGASIVSSSLGWCSLVVVALGFLL